MCVCLHWGDVTSGFSSEKGQEYHLSVAGAVKKWPMSCWSAPPLQMAVLHPLSMPGPPAPLPTLSKSYLSQASSKAISSLTLSGWIPRLPSLSVHRTSLEALTQMGRPLSYDGWQGLYPWSSPAMCHIAAPHVLLYSLEERTPG